MTLEGNSVLTCALANHVILVTFTSFSRGTEDTILYTHFIIRNLVLVFFLFFISLHPLVICRFMIFLIIFSSAGRIRRWSPWQDPAHVRSERLQLSFIRDILHHRQWVHGLGADRSASDQHQRRDDCGPQRCTVRGTSSAHRRYA